MLKREGGKSLTGKTHIMGGIAATAAFAQTSNYDPAIMIIAGALGGMIPDICHGGSKIGKKLPWLSKLINGLFGHRTLTHSILFLIIVNALLLLFIPFESIRIGILIGMASHLLLDAATKNGIKLLYPLDITFRLPLTMKTGSALESVVLTALTLIVLYYGKDILVYYL